jgi:hypothetical protein
MITQKTAQLPTSLVFDGAGWADASSSKATDIGNCRIRTTLINDTGEQWFVEIVGFEVTKFSHPNAKACEVAGWLDFAYRTSKGCSRINKPHFEYNKANVLKLVNRVTGSSFAEMEVGEYDCFQPFDSEGADNSGDSAYNALCVSPGFKVEEAPKPIEVKVTLANGDTMTMWINATLEEARTYYLGHEFGEGPEFLAVKVEEVEA